MLGKFQKIAFLLLVICFTCSVNCIFNSYVFLLKDINFRCKINNEWSSCNRTLACQQIENDKEPVFSDVKYISFINDFHLGCKENYTINLFWMVYIIGNIIGSLFATWSSDFMGRIKIIKISMILRNIVLILTIALLYEVILIISMLLLGILSSFHTNVSFILISEYVSRFEKDKYQTLMFVFGSTLSAFCGLYFLLFQNWQIFFLLNLLFSLIFCFLSYYLLESPRFLISNNKFDDAREVCKKIFIINQGIKEVNFKFEKENILAQIDRNRNSSIYLEDKVSLKNSVTPISCLFNSKKYRLSIIVFPIIFISISLNLFSTNYQRKKLNIDLYLQHIIFYLLESVFFIFSLFLINYIGKKHTLMISFIFSSLIFFLSYFQNYDDHYTIIIILFSSILGYSIIVNIMYSFANDYYSTDLKGRAIAFCLFAENIGKFFGFIIQNENYILVLSASLSLISFLLLIPVENNLVNSILIDNNEELYE